MLPKRTASPLSVFAPKTSQQIDFSIKIGPKDILHPVCVYDADSHFIAVFGIERTKEDQKPSEERFHASCVVPIQNGKEKKVVYKLFYVTDQLPWETESDDDIGHYLFHVGDKPQQYSPTNSLRPAWKYPLVYVNQENSERLALNMSQTQGGRATLARSQHDRACLPADLANSEKVASSMPSKRN